MATLEDLEDFEREEKEEKKRQDGKEDGGKSNEEDSEMKEAEEPQEILDDEVLGLSTADIITRKRLLENDSRIMKSELSRLSHEKATMGEKIKENMDKIANNRYELTKYLNLIQTLTYYEANYHTLLETSSNCLISILRQNPWRKAQTSTSMQHELANLQLLKPRLGRQSSYL